MASIFDGLRNDISEAVQTLAVGCKYDDEFFWKQSRANTADVSKTRPGIDQNKVPVFRQKAPGTPLRMLER